ncbi:MAG: PKD domain-containing protein [Candidatus Gracilibacteria bacterium]|nr:PKD domain-containing protein [Candidatus Gracilibacteria bacterium]
MSIFQKQKFNLYKLLIIFSFFVSFGIGYGASIFELNNNDQIIYCKDGDDCSIEKGVSIVKQDVQNIETEKKFSNYIQDITAYLMFFVALIGVLYIIYAGFNILTAGGNEENVKKSKKNISNVAIGIVIIFLAYSIVSFIIKVLNDSSTVYMPSLVDRTYAYTTNDKNTFDEYKKGVELLTSQLERDYKINGSLDSANLDRLETFVNGAISTFPDNNDFVGNNSIAKNLLIAIDVVKAAPDSETKITELAKKINEFVNKTKIPRISAKIVANPTSGNAPLTTSLRVAEVIDPSGVTVPSSNYIWWLKNSDGSKNILGTGPSISYTFKSERTYIVNLDIVSASRNSKGKIDTLPFSSSININVMPKIGTIFFYINGINVSDLDRFKITPQIGKSGIIIDATASQAAGGSTFTRTIWDFGNGNTTFYDLYPRIEKQYYMNEGIYKLKLKIQTNENKEITKNLELEVRDPIAAIKVSKLTGFVGEDFKISTNTYFMPGKLNYEWKIIDLTNDQTLLTSSKENISYKFLRTGKFSVRLKSTAPSGKEDTDTRVITIESRNPIGSFTAKMKNSEAPNTVFLDATQSFDPDTFSSSNLKFSWYMDGQKVDLENSSRDGSLGSYTFDTLGVHKILLEISNDEGKTVTVKKDVTVTSLLSIKLNFTPKIVQMGKSVAFIAESKEANSYEWKFGDGTTEISQNGRMYHTYSKSGNFTVTVIVKGDKSTTNSISRKIYVTYGDSPFALITLKKESSEIFETSGVCDGKDAYIIDRSKPIELSGEESINIDGTNSGLDYSWTYLGKISTQKKANFKFDELGCFPISLVVKSQKTGKIHKNISYVKVENLPPKITGLSIATANIDSDPVVVKVTANNPKDEDGVIVSYLWYYYTDSDSEPQDYRITKNPYSTFVLPKISGKYYFVLIAEDSNGAKTNTDEASEDRYFITLSSNNINTPIIDLSTDKTSIAVGDEINFRLGVKDILGRDISSKIEYKWDFDGDGIYDETTSTPQIKHNYMTPGNYNFKVKVTYKGVSNTKNQQIFVKNNLKPNFEYFAIGSKLILFNTTSGLYNTASWNLGNSILSDNLDYFVYDFGKGDFTSKATLKVFDGSDSKEMTAFVKKDIINSLKIRKSANNLIYFTFPIIENGTIKVKDAKEKVFVYLGESKGNITKYCVDTDISLDSDLNGTADDDCDNKTSTSFEKGEPFVIKDLVVNSKSKTVRFSIFEGNNLIEFKDIKMEFGFFTEPKKSEEPKISTEISEQDKINLELIKDLIKKSGKQNEVKMMQNLSAIQDNWFDDREKTKAIIDFESYVDGLTLDQKIKDEFYNLLENLLVKQDQVKDEITVAVKILKSLIPKSNPNYDSIMKNIDEILSHPVNTKLNKDLGTSILEYVKNDSNIDNKDKLIIRSQLEAIIYGGQANVPKEISEQTNAEQGSALIGFIVGFVKLFGYLILAILGVIAGFFIYFKIVNRNENLLFQDFLIEKFLREKAISPDAPVETFKKKDDVLDIVNKVVEIKAIEEEKKPEELIKEPEVIAENTTSQAIPDWLKSSSTEDVSVGSIPSFTETVTETQNTDEQAEEKETGEKKELSFDENEMPSWLKGMDAGEIQKEVHEELTKTDTKEEESEQSPAIEETSEEKEAVAADLDESDLPDWLKGSFSEKTEEDKEEIEKTSEIEDETIQSPLLQEEFSEEKEAVAADLDESDLPDWLKGSFSEKTEEDKEEIEKTSEIEDLPVAKVKKAPKKNTDNEDIVQEKPTSVKKPKKNIPIENSDELPEWLK